MVYNVDDKSAPRYLLELRECKQGAGNPWGQYPRRRGARRPTSRKCYTPRNKKYTNEATVRTGEVPGEEPNMNARPGDAGQRCTTHRTFKQMDIGNKKKKLKTIKERQIFISGQHPHDQNPSKDSNTGSSCLLLDHVCGGLFSCCYLGQSVPN